MKIDHIGLYVNDLEGARAFFIKYFGCECSGMYHNKKTDFKSYFLKFSDGSRLEVMTRPGVKPCLPQKEGEYEAGFAHIAIGTGSREEVDRLTGLFRAAGFNVLSGPRTTGDGYYESVIEGFEGNLLELTV